MIRPPREADAIRKGCFPSKSFIETAMTFSGSIAAIFGANAGITTSASTKA